ncbi:hypothetical protein ACL9RL_13710 [Plantibacter sp. Mn2098]|uniref:hypothetical protein n=1 Tax=Plantibacter sp. Mn2098 TaxID=3395266 RepID=UPI003BD12B2D
MSGMGGIDEVFNPGAFEAKQFLDAEHELPAPAPLAGDPDHDIYADGPLHIEVPADALDEGTGVVVEARLDVDAD